MGIIHRTIQRERGRIQCNRRLRHRRLITTIHSFLNPEQNHIHKITRCSNRMMISSLFLLLIVTIPPRVADAAVTASQSSSTAASSSPPPPADNKKDVFRYNNLDYIDTNTLQYYLSAPSENFDVAVLYFAQWCKNCHALAP